MLETSAWLIQGFLLCCLCVYVCSIYLCINLLVGLFVYACIHLLIYSVVCLLVWLLVCFDLLTE